MCKFIANFFILGYIFVVIHFSTVRITLDHLAVTKFVVLPKRWIVERSFGWLEKYRRLWKNCERKLSISLQMTVLAFVSILIRRF